MDLSVIIVSDYQTGEKTWEDELSILEALSKQDIEIPFEVILVENIAFKDFVPATLHQTFKELKVVFSESCKSATLKDFGVQHTTANFVAVMEADCIPNPAWLRVVYNCLKENKRYSVVSGKTSYGNETMWRRVLSLLDRSFDVLNEAGKTPHISNNGALYLREILKKFPYPDAATPFQSSRLRIEQMSNYGCEFYFEPQAVMLHAIGGLAFVIDFRRNTGYADMMCHLDKRINQIPVIMKNRFLNEVSDCLRLSKYLRWYDWPLVVTLQLIVPFLGVPGMIDALKKRDQIPNSAYR